MGGNMELRPDILRTYVASAQSLNFTKAAKRVNLTQSAVSLQIRKLEIEIGKSLFKRMSRGVELTHDGKALLGYAIRLLQLHDETIASLTQEGLEGVIRLGASEDYASIHLPGILKQFAVQYPLVQVNLFCDISSNLLEMLKEGHLDLCLRSTERLEDDCVFLRNEPIVWVSSKEAEPEKISPLPLALYPHDCVWSKLAIEALERQGIAFRIAYSSPSITGVLAAVQSGLVVAPVSATSVNAQCRVLREGVLPELPPAVVSLHQSGNMKNKAQSHFAQFIRDEFQTMPIARAPRSIVSDARFK